MTGAKPTAGSFAGKALQIGRTTSGKVQMFNRTFKTVLITAGGISQSTLNMVPDKLENVNFDLLTTAARMCENPLSVKSFQVILN